MTLGKLRACNASWLHQDWCIILIYCAARSTEHKYNLTTSYRIFNAKGDGTCTRIYGVVLSN
jgi:hypothetical protein